MTSVEMDHGSKDLFSSLPDALVCHILSFLSTKEAALTSVLAKRWRYLLASVPNLDLDNFIYGEPSKSRFKVFVDRIMALQGNGSLNKVSLRCIIYPDTACVNGWILKVLERGVLDLHVYISKYVDLDTYLRQQYYDDVLPPKVLMTKSLVRLKLESTEPIFIDVEEVCLPKLKTLSLRSVQFFDMSGAAFAKLMSGCPVLEELLMIDVASSHWESFSVSKPTLKRLTVFGAYFRNLKRLTVTLDTPNLVYLKCSVSLAVKYPKVSFDSLVEANLGLWKAYYPNENATEFIMGLGNVRILYVSSDTLKVLNQRCKTIPVFNNLMHLTIEIYQDFAWEGFSKLLENCPNLETLVFEGLVYRDTPERGHEEYCFKKTSTDDGMSICMCKPWEGTPVCISASPVKTLKVLKFGETSRPQDDMFKQLNVIEYFVKTMPNLEQVVLYFDTPINDDVRMVKSVLEREASSKCKIQVNP